MFYTQRSCNLGNRMLRDQKKAGGGGHVRCANLAINRLPLSPVPHSSDESYLCADGLPSNSKVPSSLDTNSASGGQYVFAKKARPRAPKEAEQFPGTGGHLCCDSFESEGHLPPALGSTTQDQPVGSLVLYCARRTFYIKAANKLINLLRSRIQSVLGYNPT